MGLFNVFSKKKKEDLDEGLSKTQNSVFDKLNRAVAGKSKVDEEVLDDLEEVLVTSDVSVDSTLKIIERIQNRVAREKYVKTEELNKILKEETAGLLAENDKGEGQDAVIPDQEDPYVIMVVGVNGVGKTTMIGKLAHLFKEQGKSVMLSGADTFRAAAIDQLQMWADRVDVPLVTQEMGSDPASVAYDSLQSAKKKGYDVVIVDTAGRLHNKVNLMRELGKVKDVMKKVMADAPHEVLLVLDASTGQNAVEQAKQFTESTEVTDLALTKLDGTAKGGVVISVSDQFKVPVKYIGIGEKKADLQVFNKYEFVDSIFGSKELG